MGKDIEINQEWKIILENAFQSPSFQQVRQTLYDAKQKGKVIYPPGNLIFNAFNLTPISKVKVVILGQDPYHNPHEAMGLSFSVPKHIKIPPSLKNIFKEIQTDIGGEIPSHGDLTQWAEQGVFLLNAMLTVEQHKPASHSKIGWQDFTNAVISALSQHREQVVFMLWGRFAQQKSSLIDQVRHLVLTAAHPSPLAGGAFFGSKHFSQANSYLISLGHQPIDWIIK